MRSLNCPNCGASLPAHASKVDVVTCEFCNTTFRTSNTYTPEPTMGNLLLGADFSRKPVPGWGFYNEEKIKLIPGTPPELQVSFEPKNGLYDVIGSSGLFDNVDISVTIKFLEGKHDWIYGGIFTRYGTEGGYAFLISAQSSFKLGYYSKDKEDKLAWTDLMAWTSHTALRSGLEETNRLRVICDGQRLKMYLNGVLATSIRDTRFEVGRLYVSFSSGKESNIVATISDLQLREVLK
jgi:hypothetical protein